MAMDLERRQQGEQFLVIDPPNLPEAPVFPNRLQFGIGGLAAGLMFGLLLSGYLEYRDQGLRNERDVLALTNLPTLVSIPWVLTDEKLEGRWAKFARRRDRAKQKQALGVRG
jgi:capsular polysaccharide biosynthesis protein